MAKGWVFIGWRDDVPGISTLYQRLLIVAAFNVFGGFCTALRNLFGSVFGNFLFYKAFHSMFF